MVLSDHKPANQVTQDLFGSPVEGDRRDWLIHAIGAVVERFGKSYVNLGTVEKVLLDWKMRSENRSPNYGTKCPWWRE